MCECHYCGEPIEKGQECYKVMIYEIDGKQQFVKTCSERCAEETKESSYSVHQQIADAVRHCIIQKMKNE